MRIHSEHDNDRGKRIRHLRRNLDWTQSDLAESINRTTSAISKIESGQPMSKDTLYRLSEVLKTTEHYFLNGEKPDPKRATLTGHMQSNGNFLKDESMTLKDQKLIISLEGQIEALKKMIKLLESRNEYLLHEIEELKRVKNQRSA